jgi:hypothetical protein
MKHQVMLTIASLLSILFLTLHLTDDILRGMASGKVSNLVAVPILVVWLYGTLVLTERRSGYVIILLGSLLGLGVPVIHMMGNGVGVGGTIAKSSGAFFFVWTPHRARRDRALFHHPLGARTVEPAMGPAPVVHNHEALVGAFVGAAREPPPKVIPAD